MCDCSGFLIGAQAPQDHSYLAWISPKALAFLKAIFYFTVTEDTEPSNECFENQHLLIKDRVSLFNQSCSKTTASHLI